MNRKAGPRTLVIGYGNPARGDDGLGPAVAEAIGKLDIAGITVDADYQLNVEDSSTIAGYDVVVFADASVNCDEPFSFYPLVPQAVTGIDSHHIEPGEVLGLARELFNAGTEGYVLAIRGYSFSMFTEMMTKKALENMDRALHFLVPALQSGFFHQAAQDHM